MKIAPLLIPLVLTFLVGCTHQQSYSLHIQNSSLDPITVGLVKVGGPFDPRWAAPETLAVSSPNFNGDQAHWGTVVPPGHYTESGTLTASFEKNGFAYLRIYHGALSFNDLLARSRADTERLDIPIAPGRSVFIVHYRDGKIGAVQVADPSASGWQH